MEYKINQVATISGLTTRTLRYYDQIGLLKPSYINESGYRIYTSNELDTLQQILLYKEMNLPLIDIREIMRSDTYQTLESLYNHYEEISKKITRMKSILTTIDQTIEALERKTEMNDDKKFEGLKQKNIQENERKYGTEVREKYGEQFVNKSYKKYQNLSKQDMNRIDELNKLIALKLQQAVPLNNPLSPLAQEICGLHKEWLLYFWPTYSKEAHMQLVEMYLSDERFNAYYEKICDGATDFLVRSMAYYLQKKV